MANQSRSIWILLTPALPYFSQETGTFFCVLCVAGVSRWDWVLLGGMAMEE
jgi:hypothetical protein